MNKDLLCGSPAVKAALNSSFLYIGVPPGKHERSDAVVPHTPIFAYTGQVVMPHEMQDRAARYEMHVPVEFLCEGRIVLGQCLNISESGIFATFEEPLELWTTGELRLHAGMRTCKLTARVARVEDREAGLAFRPAFGESAASTVLLIREVIQEVRALRGPFIPPF